MLADLQGGGGFTQPTTTIVLHGALAKRYGRRHRLGVRTAPQAAYALCTMVPGFREEFQDGWYRVVRGRVADGVVLSEEQLHLQAAPGGEIHFIPVARGGKNSGGIKAVLGAVILVAAVVAAIPSGGTSLAGYGAALGTTATVGGVSLGVSYGAIAFFGATMLLSGVSSLLSSTSNKLNTLVDAKTSYSLTGNTNSTTEGTPIPPVYGRTRVGSVVGSFGYYAEDYDGSSAPASEPTPSDGGNSGAVGAGGGGKGGSSSAGATEAPNTLRSRAVVRLIDILSEGPIGGLVDGAKSIFFNNTPLMASDGSYNFQGVSWEVRLGYPSQDAVSGYPASEITSTVGIEVQHLGAGRIVRTYTSTTATAARVTIRLPALAHQNPTNGNLEAYPTLNYLIEVSPSGANAYKQVVNELFINQKCTSPYEKSYRFDLPPGGTWDIRVTKLSADSASAGDQCSVFWEATTLITDQALMHPNVAYIALTIDSAAFGSQIPTRQYEIDGILCQVPYNYDPPSGTYASSGPGTAMGTWDGASFKLATTSNPAWCLYDMLVNQRYGMGLPSDTAVSNTKYDLFTIGQYCDGTVPSGFTDGNGNMIQERRYTLNAALTQQVDAYRLLQSMVSAFRGMTYWGAGRVVVTADMPTAPSYVLNSGNVIDGEFTYEGSALKSRHTVARVSWIDPNNSYMEAIEVVEDFDAVVSQGQVATDIIAFGCTSRGLARRWGKWLLDTEKNQTELISCGVGLEELRSRPGDVVRVADTAYAGVRQGGRVGAGSTAQTILLDQPIQYTAGLLYLFTFTLPDGTVIDKVGVLPNTGISNTGAGGNAIITLAQPMPAAPLPGAAWLLSTTGPSGLLPVDTRQFRVLALAEPHRGQYQLSGVIHDPNKYARVELGIEFDPTPFSTLNGLLVEPLPPPTNVAAVDYMVGVGNTTVIRVSIGWTPANDVRVVGQQIHADGPEQRDAGANGNTYDMDGLTVGTYTFRVRSVGRDGRASIWADSPPIVVDGIADPPDAPLNFTAQGGALQVKLSWNSSAARDIRHYELWRAPAAANGQHPFPYTGFTPVGSPGSNGATLVVQVAATTFLDAGDYLAPDTAWAYWVRAVNTTGAASGFTGPIKALTTYYLADSIDEGIRNTAPIAEALLGSAPKALKDLSSPGTADGQLALNASDQKLYRWNASANNGLGAWQLYIAVVPNALGQITDASIAELDATKVAGAFTPAQAASVVSAIATGAITDTMIAGLSGSKISGQISTNATMTGQQITGPLTNATMQAGRIYDVDPVTGQVVVGVDTTKLLGQIGNTQISDGAITTQKIGANQVTANNITAGAITGNKLAIAGAGNVIGNPTCQVSAWGWKVYSTVAGVQLGSVTGDGLIGSGWALAGEGTGVACLQNGVLPTGNNYIEVVWDPDSTQGVACAPNEWWEAQVYLGTHRCYADIQLEFYDGNHAYISGVTSPRVAGVAGGTILSGYGFTWTKAVSPPNAAYVRMCIVAWNDDGGDISAPHGQNPNLFFTHAVLGRSSSVSLADGAQPQPYTIGGVTQVVGGQIKTGEITARQISAGAVNASKLAISGAGNVIGNPTCPVSAWGWVSAVVAANPGTVSLGSVTGDGIGGSSIWALLGEGSGAITITGNLAGSNSEALQVYWDPDSSQGVACSPGDWWEGQAYLGLHRVWGRVVLQFFNSTTKQLVGQTGGARVAGLAGGTALSQYSFAWVKGQVPAGADRALLVLQAFNDGGSDIAGGTPGVNPYMFFTHALLGISTPLSIAAGAVPQPYSIGGVTQVVGGQIKTGAVTARQISAGAIDATKLSVGSVSNVITNSCCTVSSSGWISGAAISAVPVYSQWLLQGFGTGQIVAGSLAPGAFTDTAWSPDGDAYKPDGVNQVAWNAAVSCAPGDLWEAQVAVITAGCSSRLHLIFMAQGTDGSWQLASAPNNGDEAWATPADGRSLGQYHQQSVRGTAPGPGTYGGVYCPNGATLVTLMIRQFNSAASQAIFGSGTQSNARIYFTRAALGLAQTSSAPMAWAPGGSTQIDGGQIKTNSIVAGTLAAGAVVAGNIAAGSISTAQLAAGAITADKLAVGSSANLIWNSDPDQGLDGWSTTGYGGVQGGNAVIGTAVNINPAYKLLGSGSGWCQWTAPASSPVGVGQGFVFDWNPAGLNFQPGVGIGVPCTAGQTWGASAYIVTGNNGQCNVVLVFYDYNMNQLAVSYSPTVINNSPGAGLVLAQYTRTQVTAVAPPGASFVLFRIQLQGIPAGAVQPFMSWTHAQFSQLPDSATAIGPYQPGGVTTISGGMIKTNTLLANRITAGTITSTQIAAGSVSADKLVANSITAGQIQAGAIASDQIAANAIRTVHLASDFAILSSAQIGTAVIDSAQIKHLAVDNARIGYGAVTSMNYGSDGGGSTQRAVYVAVYGFSDYRANGSNGVVLSWRTFLTQPIFDTTSPGGPEGGGGAEGGSG